jgi:alpha-D-xyloside xylohydrolase
LHWNDAARELTIAPRTGEFPGMLRDRTFNVSLPGGTPQTVSYQGNELKVRLEK